MLWVIEDVDVAVRAAPIEGSEIGVVIVVAVAADSKLIAMVGVIAGKLLVGIVPETA